MQELKRICYVDACRAARGRRQRQSLSWDCPKHQARAVPYLQALDNLISPSAEGCCLLSALYTPLRVAANCTVHVSLCSADAASSGLTVGTAPAAPGGAAGRQANTYLSCTTTQCSLPAQSFRDKPSASVRPWCSTSTGNLV